MKPSRPKKRKGQRLKSISSNVSPPRPDLPARFELLNDDTLSLILKYVGNKSYKSFGALNSHCKEIYLTTEGMTKETFVYGYAPLAVIKGYIERAGYYSWLHKTVGKGVVLYNRRDVIDWLLQERKNDLLREICEVAAGEERTKILDEVWNNVDDKRYVFRIVDSNTAFYSKLNMLKWLEEKGLPICKYGCPTITAACGGHLDILQWLREDKGFELDRKLHCFAVRGGHMNVLEWLREKEVDWHRYTFKYAAEKGNLDVLQWLHNEGCPWDDSPWCRVHEDKVIPDVLEWLRSHGYSDRVW